MNRPKLKVVPRELAFVLDEVLEYDVPGLEFPQPPLVIDLGANIGAFAAFARERWPGAHVVCFEPHPENQAVLVENAKAMGGEGKLRVDRRAVMGGAWVGDPFGVRQGREPGQREHQQRARGYRAGHRTRGL